jgi:hypothetical protein
MEASQHSLLAACFTLHSINATLAIVPQRGAGLWIISNKLLSFIRRWKKFMYTYRGVFFREVACTRYDAPWFVKWMEFKKTDVLVGIWEEEVVAKTGYYPRFCNLM